MAMDDDERLVTRTTIYPEREMASVASSSATNLSLLDKVESTKDLEEIMSPPEPTESNETAENHGEDTNASALTITPKNLKK
ncbi:hypothetical protein HII31_01912 [Pseudocercospora fuligena]|uniref:Uncharacterized protein n=1 Tax=Pseudocercospora fuligena TaxID=685502 RepID=A0A8H6RSY8_9PEZI|nr:hypothetical protein HII31_01912 [Pseudocercospora fuligena]